MHDDSSKVEEGAPDQQQSLTQDEQPTLDQIVQILQKDRAERSADNLKQLAEYLCKS